MPHRLPPEASTRPADYRADAADAVVSSRPMVAGSSSLDRVPAADREINPPDHLVRGAVVKGRRLVLHSERPAGRAAYAGAESESKLAHHRVVHGGSDLLDAIVRPARMHAIGQQHHIYVAFRVNPE